MPAARGINMKNGISHPNSYPLLTFPVLSFQHGCKKHRIVWGISASRMSQYFLSRRSSLDWLLCILQINNSFTPVLIEFWAKWCNRSEEMSLDGPSKKYHRPGFYKVDIDAHPEISAAVGIRAVFLPSYVLGWTSHSYPSLFVTVADVHYIPQGQERLWYSWDDWWSWGTGCE